MSSEINSSVFEAQLQDDLNAENKAKAEIQFYSHAGEMSKLQIKRLRDDNEARKSFSNYIFTVNVAWMFFILVIVVACGKGFLKLSDTVLVTLITTTTANVFGFLYVVVNYLFNKEKST